MFAAAAKREGKASSNGSGVDVLTNDLQISESNGSWKGVDGLAKDSEFKGATFENGSRNGVDVNPSHRTCTGVLFSHPRSRSRTFMMRSISLTFHGHELIVESELYLHDGRRYGLIGPNGCGKSTFLTSLGMRELPIPDHIDIYHVSSSTKIDASGMSLLDAVIDGDKERLKLEQEAKELEALEPDAYKAIGARELLDFIYRRLELMNAAPAKERAAEVLFGLGFDEEMQAKKTRDISGRGRMRVALAKALFMKPSVLLLDEPTNFLDGYACRWLQDTLKNSKLILVVVSHSRDFLNEVCTNIIHMQQNKGLAQYSGNYDEFAQTLSEIEKIKMSGKISREHAPVFRFTDVEELSSPVLRFSGVSFGYTQDSLVYKNITFEVDHDSRVALTGLNGAGKSTLLKLMAGELEHTDGMISRQGRLKIGHYHQHLIENLDIDLSAWQYMMREYPGTKVEDMKAAVGRFGLTGKAQVMPMKNLSDGQKSRVIFAWLAYKVPNMLLLDEPTNHLDIETIDSLAEALNGWSGGVVLVSNDFRIIKQVARKVWLCGNQKVIRYEDKGTFLQIEP